jgi:Tfp pilus assembly protein PilP
MKTNFFITVILAMLIAFMSCKSKAQKDAEDYMNKIERTVKENSPADNQQKTSTGPFVIPEGMENIVGEWEIDLYCN